MKTSLFSLLLALACSSVGLAQAPLTRSELPAKDVRIISPSDLEIAPPTAKELRIARAQYRDRQRVARMEYNLWIGHEPLRPRFNAIPMMSSRYPTPRIYIPVYIQPR